MSSRRTVTLPLEDWDMIQTVIKGAQIDIGYQLTTEDMHPEDRRTNKEAGEHLDRIMTDIYNQTGVTS